MQGLSTTLEFALKKQRKVILNGQTKNDTARTVRGEVPPTIQDGLYNEDGTRYNPKARQCSK